MGFNPFKSIDRVLDKGSNALQSAASSVRNEFNDTTRTIRRTTSSAVNTVRREIGETSQAVRRTTNNFANTARREWNETTQAVRRTTNRAVNTARREIGETSQAVRRTTNNFANTARREIGETSQAVRRTTNNFANTARQVNWSDVGHTVLDGAGFIPVVGTAADVAHGAWYAAEGDWKMAAFSLGAAVPIVGDAAAAAKGVTKVANAAKAVRKTTNVADKSVEGATNIAAKAEKGEPWRYSYDARRVAPDHPAKPLTSHQLKKMRIDMAKDPKAPLTEVQRQKIIATGGANLTWKNPVTGKVERMEFSHEPTPFREGGTKGVLRWQEDHARRDPHRHLSRKEREAYANRGDEIRKAFAKEVVAKEWGYKIDESKL